MNREINQTCQGIDCEDILNKKFYPVWFFTNERIGKFFQRLKHHKEIKRVFSVGGSGDFAFSLLSMQTLNQIEEINVCDIRQMANISIDLKIGLFRNLPYDRILDLSMRRNSAHKRQIYDEVRETITPVSRKTFDLIIENCKKDDFLGCLKQSGLWYKDSFWQIKNKNDYLPYLASKERYKKLQKNLDKITIYCGDFRDNLELFRDSYFDLIYTSNILDSGKYCPESGLQLLSIREKLDSKGLLFIATQNNPEKMIGLVEEKGFRLCQKEIHQFNVISSLLGHYAYSFLLFEKNVLTKKKS